MNKQKTLRPLDIGCVLWLARHPDALYERMSYALHMSLSVVHRSVQRLANSGLLLPDSRRINRGAVLEFIVHGVRYAFPPSLGMEVRGVPTAGLIPEIRSRIAEARGGVWPYAKGTVRGPALTPLFSEAPAVAVEDRALHRDLALVDMLRIGQRREREVAEELLQSLGSSE